MRPNSPRDTRNQPRHSAERPREKRRILLPGSIIAACSAVAVSVGLATGGGAIGAIPEPTPAAIEGSARVAQPEPIVRGSIIAANGTSAGTVAGGTVVTVTGGDLNEVASVKFGANPGTVVSVTTDTVTLSTPPSTGRGLGTVPVELFDVRGEPVPVDSAGTASLAAAPLSFRYIADPKVAAQTDYVLAHWQDYNTARYGRLGGTDCVNFTSQSLIARGWTMDAQWSFNAGTRQYSPAWASSTAFAAYLAAHPERATALSDDQRAQVRVGDVVQFDWNGSGDRDHTGIVTRVDRAAGGVRIYYASHTMDNDFKSVDESLANAGGTVAYWSIT
ncbi:amidase domain-containing protein [Cryobacterium tagatosivorans]|uniref:amidase domain-containing protein n=1 Tax=Cryobacterium tagatosivorans TaxID=1259199 RepID=UPI00141BA8B0|nr:amidase domain-containing protein [Cryobacterium tagatosivorans]